MPDQHRHPKMSVRPPVEIREAAKAVLDDRGWSLQEFVTACLSALVHDPDRVIAAVAGAKPTRRRGRPPKAATSDGAD